MNKEYAEIITGGLQVMATATGQEWEYTPTGGNCDSFTLPAPAKGESAYYMVTVSGGACIPETEAEWFHVSLGFFRDGNDEGTMIVECGTLADIADFFGGEL